MTDERFIAKIENTALKKAERMNTNRVFTPRSGEKGATITPQQVASRVSVIAVPETRAHLVADQRMIDALRRVQAATRNVRTVIMPIRGWRPR